MRGKAGFAWLHAAADGITPAYAGKSGVVIFRKFFFQDHPRLCGEKHTRHCATWKQ